MRRKDFAEVGGREADHVGKHPQGEVGVRVILVDVLARRLRGLLVAVAAAQTQVAGEDRDELHAL